MNTNQSSIQSETLKPQDLLVEIRGLLRIVHHPGNVAELERPDAVMRQMLAEIAPVPEQRDAGALVVAKGQHRSRAGNGIIAQFTFDAVLVQFACERAKIGIGRNFKGQHGAALRVAFIELNGELPDLGGEKRVILLALNQHQADDFGVIVDHAWQIGCLESGVSDPSELDHGILLPARLRCGLRVQSYHAAATEGLRRTQSGTCQ